MLGLTALETEITWWSDWGV